MWDFIRPMTIEAPRPEYEENCKRLRLLRAALGVTQTQMAGLLGISQTAWALSENGRRISLDNALLLRERFAIGLDWVYCGNMFQLPIGIAEKLFECEEMVAAKVAEEAAEEAAQGAADVYELLEDEHD